MSLSKKAKAIQEQIDSSKDYSLVDAIELLKSAPKAKFNESVDISINLGIDATKSDQGVRGSSTLPHGIGKTMTVVAFADGEDEKAAKDAGADDAAVNELVQAAVTKKASELKIVINPRYGVWDSNSFAVVAKDPAGDAVTDK
jgi:large subunit ribosomal protein L1